MRRDEKTLEKIYEREASTGAFIISVAIQNYVDIFNELDSAPFKRRDLDRDLRVFLEESSSDIPLRYDVILQFNISREKQDAEKEEKIKLGLKTYFTFVRNSMERKIRSSYQKSILYVLAAFLLLFIAYSLQMQVTENIVLTTLVGGIIIGGWVFLWEAISTFAFKSRDAREKYMQYKRLSTAPTRFDYFPKENT
jgi:hypothetical protein